MIRSVIVWMSLLMACTSPAVPPADEPGLAVWRGRSVQAVTSASYDADPFDRAVLSWNAGGPVTAEIGIAGQWYVLCTPEGGVKGDSVDVDTLVLKEPVRSFRFRVTPAPGTEVTLAAVTTWKHGVPAPCSEARSEAWGRVLDVPPRSQGVEKKDPGEICSPTSVSMVLEYHGVKRTTAEVCEGVYDRAQKMYGNWPLNTAYAHRAGGLESMVVRARGMDLLEREIAAGRPVVLSHVWKKGDLDGAPIPSSNGHLIVVVGFTESGDVVVNDPAAKPGEVRRIYKRRQLHATWQERGSGIVYLMRPSPR